jgi:hypothetical protein
MHPDDKDFAEWLQLPVTQYVMAAMQALAEREMQAWQDCAWEGNLDPLALHTARARVEVSNEFIGNSFGDWKAINDPES